MKVAQAVLQGSLKLRLVPHFPLMRAMYACISEIIDSEVDDLLITGQLAESFGGFFSYLPDEFFIACEEFFANVDTDFDATPSVPAYAIVKDCGKAILDLVRPLFHRDILERGLFPELRKQLLDNENAASEISQVDRILGKKKIIGSDKYDAEPEELVRLYLRHTPFYKFLHARVPFRIPRSTYAEHGALFAKSGHGKTQTLRAIVAGFLQEEDPPALFIMDSLGSLIEGIAELEVFDTRLKDRLVILDPSDPTHMPALNFFKLESDDLCFYLFKAIDQTFTQRQATMISYLMELMRNIPNANLLMLINVCESKDNPYPQVLKQLSPFAQSFFENQFYAKKPDQLVQQTRNQIAARIYTLARMPKFEKIFSASRNVFDPYRCMQEKKICLINTDARPPRLGGLGEASSVFGRFILALCLDAARGRPKHERHLALLIVDEAKAYMDEHAALILSDARQFGLGMLLASQFPHQLEEGVRREINTNTSIRMMGPLEYAVASQYARDMFTTPEFIMRMRSHSGSHTEWAAYVANTTDHAIRLSVPFGALERMPKVDAGRRAASAPHPRDTVSNTELTSDEAMAPTTSYTRTATGPIEPAPPSSDSDDLIKPGKDWST